VPTILLIRHAQASFGEADYDVLSDLGHRQVEALARSLGRRGITPDLVVTGALRRQRDTAGPWAPPAGPRAVVDERFDEYDDDDVLGHHSSSTVRLRRTPSEAGSAPTSREFQVLLDGALQNWVEAEGASPAVRPWPVFLGGIDAALDDVAGRLGKGQTAFVFSSSGVIAAAAALLLGAPAETFVALNRVSINAAVTKVIVGSRGRTLVSYNGHGHLEGGDGSLVTYR
jgi:broad specificity phosphatase PhoE